MGGIKSNLLVLVAAFVGLALLAGLISLLFIIGTGVRVQGGAAGPVAGSEIVLPIVILASVLALLIVLGLLTLLLSMLGLGTQGEALGLPGGSVRAVLALMLFVVFAIIAIYLFGIVIKEDKGAGIDLAKQLIVLIGTLVTAVASFYFGSNSSAAATKAALVQAQVQAQAGGAGPNAERVDPRALVVDRPNQPFKVTGTNLGKVSSLKLHYMQEAPIIADNVTASENEVTASITVPAGKPTGPWDVEVSDGANNFSKVREAVILNPADAAAGGARLT